jgi:glutaconyl-CoA/methylmalonyl-CoA decarboxylase subunit delta
MIFEKFFRLLSLKQKRKKIARSVKMKELLGLKEVPNADMVAIAMALHMYYDEVHDDESNVITIKRIERRYSPWSSKIYGINNK